MGLVSYAPNIRMFGIRHNGKNGNSWAGWQDWMVMWWHTGAGNSKVGSVSDGLSNTIGVMEKHMVAGDAQMFYRDWGVRAGSGDAPWVSGGGPMGISMWATTDTPQNGLAVFGLVCDDPSQTWDNNYGQWWRQDCRFAAGQPEFFLPPTNKVIPSQMSHYNIYPMASGNAQGLMMDGSVRGFRVGLSTAAWSAAVTPNGGEVANLD
jgi:hypothetical protein